MGGLSHTMLAGGGTLPTIPGLSGLDNPTQTEPVETVSPETVEETECRETAAEETVAIETAATLPAETVAVTEETQTVTDPQGAAFNSSWLYAALALVILLLVCLVADTLRRGRKQKKQATFRQEETVVPPGNGVTGPEVPAPLCVTAAVLQGQGAREDQQDCYGYSEPARYAQQGVLAVVADGMGGLANGSVVSSALVQIFQEGFQSMAAYARPAELLLEMAARANIQINQMLRGTPRSGSTLVSAVIRDGNLYFLTVGDSHIYLYRGGALLQLNREHIYQEELAVKAVNREVPLSQVQGDRQAHSLTSYFGIGKIPGLDRNDKGIKLITGDRILLATDGVFGTLTEQQLAQAMKQEIDSAAKQIEEAVREANRPYQDNFTGIILEYRE